MPRYPRPADDLYDSDASSSPNQDQFEAGNDLCNVDNDTRLGLETGATDIDNFEEEEDWDADDQINVFGGNVHPAEYYRTAVQEFNESNFDNEDYSSGSILLLDAIEAQWQCFCTNILERDPQNAFESVSLAILYNFFDWCLNQKLGKGGRKKKGIKKKSSLASAWKVFRLVYERAIGSKLNPKFNRDMHKVLRSLAKKHKLSSQTRENRCMTISDLKEQIHTTLTTTKMSFGLGELRILAVLFLLLLAPAGSRPTSILRLRFGDIHVVLARDPLGGPHRILIKFTLGFTKTYLGTKDAKTFTIPEIMFDPSLLLSPHVFLLGILFRHRAFLAPHLVSSQQLDRLKIHPDERELRLPLRDDLNDTCIFRRAVKTLTGYEMSQTEPIPSGMMSTWIRKIGDILGREYPTIAYSLRYNAGNELDQSPDVSEALRNLALDHANSNPFQKHYLGRVISVDLWGILREQKPQQALLKQSCSIGHSASKRRPLGLTAEQSASINTDKRVRRLVKEIQSLRGRSKKQEEKGRELRNLKQRLRRELELKIRDEWTDKQAVDDIELQLQGATFPETTVVDAAAYPPERPQMQLLVQALTAPPDSTLEGQYRRRDNAIDTIVAYCSVVEGRTKRRTPVVCSKPAHQNASSAREAPAVDSVSAAVLSVFVQNETQRPRRCFLCVGAVLSLKPEDSYVPELIHEFYTSGDLTKHFRRRHLAHLQDDMIPECRVCEMELSNKMHLQRHALEIHGLVS